MKPLQIGFSQVAIKGLLRFSQIRSARLTLLAGISSRGSTPTKIFNRRTGKNQNEIKQNPER